MRSSMDGLGSAKAFACYFTKVTTDTALISETFGAFALSSVGFALTWQKNTQAKGFSIPIVIGLAVAIIIGIIGPISGASLNPARELGPRLVLCVFRWSYTAFYQLFLYLLAPIWGATLGGFFCRLCFVQRAIVLNDVMEEQAVVAEVWVQIQSKQNRFVNSSSPSFYIRVAITVQLYL